MAINMIATNGQKQYHVDEYVIDSPDDISKLPTLAAPGSVALCTSNGELYIKNGNKEWVAI